MAEMIKHKDEWFHLVPNSKSNFDNYEAIIGKRYWCWERWGNPISNNNYTGEWDYFIAGYIFRHEHCKIEFIMRWL